MGRPICALRGSRGMGRRRSGSRRKCCCRRPGEPGQSIWLSLLRTFRSPPNGARTSVGGSLVRNARGRADPAGPGGARPRDRAARHRRSQLRPTTRVKPGRQDAATGLKRAHPVLASDPLPSRALTCPGPIAAGSGVGSGFRADRRQCFRRGRTTPSRRDALWFRRPDPALGQAGDRIPHACRGVEAGRRAAGQDRSTARQLGPRASYRCARRCADPGENACILETTTRRIEPR